MQSFRERKRLRKRPLAILAADPNPGGHCARMPRQTGDFSFLLIASVLLFSVGPANAQPSPTLQRMADSISVAKLTEHIKNLEQGGGYFSRVNFTPGNDSAAAYLQRAFNTIPGMTLVVCDTFYIASASGGLNTKPLMNIVATLAGKKDPTKIFVAGAHFDCSGSRMGSSVWNALWNTIRAPGADDNATGLASILEMARIMSDPEFGFVPDFTIEFVAFGAEESGPAYSGSHHGSTHLADAAKNAGQNIVGMVSIDMIGYNPAHLYQSIITNSSSTALAAGFTTAATMYAPGLIASVTNNATATYSDHSSFWNDGFPAICLMENAPPWNSNAYYQANPYYHTSYDSTGTVNMELVRQVTRMALTAIATIATGTTDIRGPSPPALPASFALDDGYPNPFNAASVITYRLPVTASARLVVFDMLGRPVATLVDEVKPAGSHAVTWNASGFASGIYFCRLEAGRFTETKKLVLLR